MSTKVQKWGNSLAVRFPKEIAARFKLQAGSEVSIVPESKKIAIKPVKKTAKKVTLKELVKGISPNNRHEETDWGYPVGREIW